MKIDTDSIYSFDNQYFPRQKSGHEYGIIKFAFRDYIPERLICGGVSTISPKNFENQHTHEYFELILIESGCGFHHVGKEKIPITRGDLLIINNRLTHSYSAQEEMRRSFICFHPVFLDNAAGRETADKRYFLATDLFRIFFRPGANKISLEEKDFPKTLIMFRQILDTTDNSMPFFFEQKKNYLVNLLYQINYLFKKNFFGNEEYERAGQIMLYIRKNFSMPVNLKMIAGELGMNRAYISSFFRKKIGITIVEYIAKVRLDEAGKQLIHSNKKIIEIAYACGFGTISHFNHLFQKEYSLSPKAYRIQHRAYSK